MPETAAESEKAGTSDRTSPNMPETAAESEAAGVLACRMSNEPAIHMLFRSPSARPDPAACSARSACSPR